MLTRKQHELLMLIDMKLSATGVPPSYDEMKDALGLKSKSGIHRLITGLEERGVIRRLPHRARAIEVLKLPGDAHRPQNRENFSPNVIEGNFRPSRLRGKEQEEQQASTSTVALPVHGKIAAGTPIEALQNPGRTVDIPAAMLGSGEHYALEVEGDSMIEAGILDGDTVVIRRCDTADNGDIVVALIEDHEATLKRLRRRGESVALEPANASYKTRIFGPDQVAIQGRLVGLVRLY
jgi:repressor LexA